VEQLAEGVEGLPERDALTGDGLERLIGCQEPLTEGLELG
jgi:hypothetical protein